jgi:hypothetical protein
MWVKGKADAQSLEDMYLVVYEGLVGSGPTDHNDLAVLGKARFVSVTQKPDWTYWRADIDYNFKSLESVRAFGIGMSPTDYGHGNIQIDSMSVDYTGLGGVIDNFETYVDANYMNVDFVAWNCSVDLTDEPNAFEGDHALKVEVDYSVSPHWAKIMFDENVRHLGYDWSGYRDYKTLTVHFKVIDADGYIQVALVDGGGDNIVSYKYNNGARIPEGDWIRWDIDIDPNESETQLDDVRRVDVQFMPEDYGQGVIYVDNIHVNACSTIINGNLFVDGNCVIDFKDFAVFASHWQRTDCDYFNGYCDGADFRSLGGTPPDGEVNIDDLAELADEWLECNQLFKGDCF